MTSNHNKQKIADEMTLEEENQMREDAEKERATVAVEATSFAFKDHLQQAEVLQRINPILYDKGRMYWAWNSKEKCYVQVDQTDILNSLKTSTGDRDVIKSHVRAQVLEAIRMTGRDKWNRIKDVPTSWIQFADCVYDLDTDETHKASQEYFYINPIPHNLGDSNDTPVIDRLFGEWVGDDYKQRLYEILSYAMYNDYPIHRVFTFFGSGRNGKGQYMNLLKKFVGMPNTCSTSLDRLSDSRFEPTKLRGRKVAFVSETNSTTLSKTDQIKSLCGGDLIGGEYKGGAHFDFVNTAKIIIATNSLPETTDKTRGFFARWIITDFIHEFEGGKPVIDEIGDSEYSNLCRKCIGVLKQLLENGKFDKEGTIDDKTTKYIETSDPMTTFIRDMCIESWDAREPTFNFVKQYQEWCGVKRFRIGKDADVRKQIGSKFESSPRETWFINGEQKQWNTVIGLQIRGSEYAEKDLQDEQDEHLTSPSRIGGSESNVFSVLAVLNEEKTPVKGDSEFEQSIKSSIYKVGYVRGLKTFTATDILMEMPRELKTTLEVVAEYLEQHKFELVIEADGKSWKKVGVDGNV